MKADTIDILTGKGHFPTEQALAVAEAIDMAIRDAQLVTVPILDARFLASEAKMDARFTTSEARMDARFAAREAEIDARFAAHEAKIDARFAASEARIDARFAASEAKMEARFVAMEARLDQKFDRLRLQLIIAILLGYAAMGPLGTAAVEALKRAF